MFRHTHVLAHLTHAKLQKLACAHTVARNCGVYTWDSEYMQHVRNAHHKLALGLSHVAVGNEIQLCCS